MAIDVVLKWLTEGAQKAAEEAGKISEEIEKTGEKAEETGKKFDEAGDKVEDTGNKVEKLGDKTSKAKSEAEKLTDAFKNVRKAGLAIAAVGAGMSVLAHRMTEAKIEADKLQGMLNAKLSSAGLTQASGQIQEMAHSLALLNGEDPLKLADKIANVVSTGRGFRSLAKSGIVISTEERSAIRAADPEEQWELIQKAAQRSMGEIESTLTDLQKATYAQQVRWGELQETMGEGSSVVRTALYNNVLSPLYSILETNDGLAKTAGGVAAIGGAGLSMAGGLLATGAQLGLLLQAFPKLRVMAGTTFTTITTGANTAAIAVAKLGAAVGLITVAIYGLTTAWNGSKDAAKMDNEELEKKWKLWGKLWNFLSNIGDTKIGRFFFAILDGRGIQEARNLMKEETGKTERFDRKRDIDHSKRQDKNTAETIANETTKQMQDIMNQSAVASGGAAVAATVNIPVTSNATNASFTPPSISDAQMIRAAEKAEAERLGLGAPQAQNKVTLYPETRASQNSRGNWVVEILPKSFEIPNAFGRAVEAL